MPAMRANSTRDAFPSRAIDSTIRRWFNRRRCVVVAITGNVPPKLGNVKLIQVPIGMDNQKGDQVPESLNWD